MNRMFVAVVFISVIWLSIFVSGAHAAPCLMITLTGTQGGPPAFKGLAGPWNIGALWRGQQ
jgi:ribonuclease Z